MWIFVLSRTGDGTPGDVPCVPHGVEKFYLTKVFCPTVADALALKETEIEWPACSIQSQIDQPAPEWAKWRGG